MKTILTILVVLISITACQSNKQQKVEKLVTAYLAEHLNDPKSYEAISFDSITTVYTQYEMDTPDGRKLDTLAANLFDSLSKYEDHSKHSVISPYYGLKSVPKLAKFYQTKLDSVHKLSAERSKHYTPRPWFYNIVHSYRAKNGFGALTIGKSKFTIDSSLTTITEVSNL